MAGRTVLVSGSRTWHSPGAITRTFQAWQAETEADEVVLVHGGARGADRQAADAARQMGWSVDEMPADWSVGGRRAGIQRNLRMLDRNPEHVFIFWDGESRGTKHVIDEVAKRNLPHTLVLASEIPRTIAEASPALDQIRHEPIVVPEPPDRYTALDELSTLWQSFGCAVCGQVARPGAIGGWRIELHHIKPRSRGGGDEPANLMGLCGELLPNKCHWLVTTNRMRLEWSEAAGWWTWLVVATGETDLCRQLSVEMLRETGLYGALASPASTRRDVSLRQRPVPAEALTALVERESLPPAVYLPGGEGAQARFTVARGLIRAVQQGWLSLALVIQKGQQLGDPQMLGFEDANEWADAIGVDASTFSKLRTIGMQFAGAWESLPAGERSQLSLEGMYLAAKMVRMGRWTEEQALHEAVAQPTNKLWMLWKEASGHVPEGSKWCSCPTCGQRHITGQTGASVAAVSGAGPPSA